MARRIIARLQEGNEGPPLVLEEIQAHEQKHIFICRHRTAADGPGGWAELPAPSRMAEGGIEVDSWHREARADRAPVQPRARRERPPIAFTIAERYARS